VIQVSHIGIGIGIGGYSHSNIGHRTSVVNLESVVLYTKIIKIVATREEERREGKGGTGKGPASIYGLSS